jgi:arsenate reductase
MSTPLYNVLFLCTGNSARSLMAECALARWGEGRFGSFSAGSHPKEAPHPRTLALLEARHYDVSGLRSKSWDEFAAPGAPELHFVFTVCDDARGESCPVWPGQPMTAHWGVPDPAAVEGPDDLVELAFRRAYGELEERIKLFTSLPLEALDRIALRAKLEAIGKGEGLDDA